MLKHNEVNPLSVFGLRRVEHCPPHFTQINFDLACSEKTIADWIYENLDGRFYLGDFYVESSTGSLNMQKTAAFETSGEASYFSLVLDTINKYNYGDF
jgi:hypothetical protein